MLSNIISLRQSYKIRSLHREEMESEFKNKSEIRARRNQPPFNEQYVKKSSRVLNKIGGPSTTTPGLLASNTQTTRRGEDAEE